MFDLKRFDTRRFVAAISLTVLLTGASGVPTAFAETPIKGSIVKTEENSNNPSINPDDLKEVKKGTPLDMTVTTSLSTGGDTQVGDEFFAKVSSDYLVDGKVVIPRDTIVHGIVETLADPKRAGRNGYVNTRFDYMITPDGREISIDGEYSSKDSAGKSVAKMVGRGAGYTLAGGLVGALVVLKYAGLAGVAASNGYALAGGAAVGGVAGLTTAMVKKGHNVMIQPGAELRFQLQDDLTLPTVNMPDVAANDYTLEGLDIDVLGMRFDKDPFGNANELTLSLNLTNNTPNTFSFFDIGLEDEHGTTFYASPFGDTGMWFRKLTPNSRIASNISFSVDNPKLQHYLVFYKQYTREPVAKFAITDAMKTDKKTADAKVKSALQTR